MTDLLRFIVFSYLSLFLNSNFTEPATIKTALSGGGGASWPAKDVVDTAFICRGEKTNISKRLKAGGRTEQQQQQLQEEKCDV